MDVSLSEDGSTVTFIHRLRNGAPNTRKLSPWAITAFAPGGVGFLPFKLDKDNPTPKSSLVFSAWDYTDLADARIQWTSRCLLVHQNVKVSRWLKVALNSSLGVMAYLRSTDLLIKKYPVFPGESYPDNGSTGECWTNDVYLELESLAPVQMTEPGQCAEFTENWTLVKIPSVTKESEALVEQVLPLMLS
jgi:hypothetical protein